jgi:hypothetical protein
MEYRYIYLLALILHTDAALAYVGPGLGLGVIGSVFGVIAAILLAIIGVVWYPLKRLLRRDGATIEDDKNQDES